MFTQSDALIVNYCRSYSHMKTVKIGKFHILELIISGFMEFCYGVIGAIGQSAVWCGLYNTDRGCTVPAEHPSHD